MSIKDYLIQPKNEFVPLKESSNIQIGEGVEENVGLLKVKDASQKPISNIESLPLQENEKLQKALWCFIFLVLYFYGF